MRNQANISNEQKVENGLRALQGKKISCWVNPDLTGEEKSISFQTDIGNEEFCVEVINFPFEAVRFFIDGGEVSEERWHAEIEEREEKSNQ